ncbi:MAG: sarcosine oxidase subunit gamma, partial [Cereibacter sp.]
MSDPVSALGHAAFDGFARIREIGPLGMITLRARADLPALPAAVTAATGLGLPAVRRIVTAGDRSIGWMSPDEWLIVLPYPQVAQTLAGLAEALQGQHHLAVDVSDARAVLR